MDYFHHQVGNIYEGPVRNEFHPDPNRETLYNRSDMPSDNWSSYISCRAYVMAISYTASDNSWSLVQEYLSSGESYADRIIGDLTKIVNMPHILPWLENPVRRSLLTAVTRLNVRDGVYFGDNRLTCVPMMRLSCLD